MPPILKWICWTKYYCYTKTSGCVITKLVYYSAETSDKMICLAALIKSKLIKVQAISLFISSCSLCHLVSGDLCMHTHKSWPWSLLRTLLIFIFWRLTLILSINTHTHNIQYQPYYRPISKINYPQMNLLWK